MHVVPDAMARELAARSDADPARNQRLAGTLCEFIRSVPHVLQSIVVFAGGARANGSNSSRAVEFATGQVLFYLVDDRDLLPESEFGVLGLIDDAYLVHRFAARLTAYYPEFASDHMVTDPAVLAVVRALLPAGVAEAIDQSAASLVHLSAALFAVPGGGGADAQSTVELRIDAALALIDAARTA